MKKLLINQQFKEDIERAKSNPKQDLQALNEVVTILVSGEDLSSEYLLVPHFGGEFQYIFESHIQTDFILVYQTTYDSVMLCRCGSHAELFG